MNFVHFKWPQRRTSSKQNFPATFLRRSTWLDFKDSFRPLISFSSQGNNSWNWQRSFFFANVRHLDLSGRLSALIKFVVRFKLASGNFTSALRHLHDKSLFSDETEFTLVEIRSRSKIIYPLGMSFKDIHSIETCLSHLIF